MKKFISISIVLFLLVFSSGFSFNNKMSKLKSLDLDNTCIDWFFIPNNDFRTPEINDKLNFKLSDYNAVYNGPKSPQNKGHIGWGYLGRPPIGGPMFHVERCEIIFNNVKRT